MSIEAKRIHVIPLNDSKDHQQSAACKCQPSIEEDGRLVIHNAWDFREADEPERQQATKRIIEMSTPEPPVDGRSDPLNEIILELWDYANANGSFGPAELRSHAQKVADLVGRARSERSELLRSVSKLCGRMRRYPQTADDWEAAALYAQALVERFDHDARGEREMLEDSK